MDTIILFNKGNLSLAVYVLNQIPPSFSLKNSFSEMSAGRSSHIKGEILSSDLKVCILTWKQRFKS